MIQHLVEQFQVHLREMQNFLLMITKNNNEASPYDLFHEQNEALFSDVVQNNVDLIKRLSM